MMKNELVVVVSNDNKGTSIKDTIYAIKQAGFKNVFVQWYDRDWQFDQLSQVELCKQLGLKIIFAHLGYQRINDLWLDNEIGEAFVQRFIKDIDDCHNLGIEMVIMHLSSKFETPRVSEIGLNRIKKIVEHAKKIGVKIAFENTKVLSHLYYVLDNIKDDNVGFCFDVGHYHCNNKDGFDISPFNNRVMAVHLHDNNGLSDQHLLPFDGTLNWPKVIKLLKDNHYEGPITMELCYRNDYLKMDAKEFYRKGYQRGLALQKLFEE